MKLTKILAVPFLAAISIGAVEGKSKGFRNKILSVKDVQMPPSALAVMGGLGPNINLAKRMSAADVEELDHYTSETLAGLDKLVDNVLDGNLEAAQSEYNAIAPLFQEMMRYAAPPKSFCVVNGAGQNITQVQAVGLIRGIQMSLQVMLQAALAQNQGETLAELCDAEKKYFNSGLREAIFQHGQVSGTGP